MNERAATPGGLPPLWHLGQGKSIFAGALHYNSDHSHSVPVLVTGLYGPFGIRLKGDQSLSVDAVIVRAGTSYELFAGGDAIAVIYLEPSVGGAELLEPLVSNSVDLGVALIGACNVRPLLRELYEDGQSITWAAAALDDLIRHTGKRAQRFFDPRISHSLSRLEKCAEQRSAAQEASALRLSSSRFQHLFTEHVGVPFRRYRAWCRLRNAISEIIDGSDFTAAAHQAGYADQAHFSRSFRQTFGAPPSGSLAKVRT